ncbi:hypothetical protein RHSIM_Rhsim05G0183800 [Rhododendron simsii]|uniref:MLO-like protein n=1 Tax=Rhododendron simsii TaxID=118357 RepID=A0A834H1N0_RHOSS|nr:hypothetical protein RHSIM_Rhsim05G0183800 [Rhododendron simsii]
MGQVPFVSTYGIHQLHIFIFVLAVFHVLYCIITLALGRAKMRKWKAWEMETKTTEYQFTNDPERFRFTRDTSFGRRHLNFWSHSPFLLWTACFFRQFVTSVPKVDYLTLRHGFISAHLGPESRTNFDFQQYIKRSLEEDFKIILLIGTKLQVIITKMGLRIQDRGDIVKGTPMVQPGDELFWFNRPRLLLYLIQFILFQVSDFATDKNLQWKLAVLIQIVCSYVTLPLYALVTQMGSNMKPTIFNDQIAKALRNWHQTAKKHIKQNRQSPGTVTSLQSGPGTPLHSASPVHLLHNYRSEIDSVSMSPEVSNFENVVWESDGPPSRHCDRHRDLVVQQETEGVQESSLVTSASGDCNELSTIRAERGFIVSRCPVPSISVRPSLTNLLLKFEDFFSIEGDITGEQFASLFRSTPNNQLHEEQTAMELEIDTRAHVNSSLLNLTHKDNLCSEEVEDMPVELEVDPRARVNSCRHFLGRMDALCPFCKALHWVDEKLVKSSLKNSVSELAACKESQCFHESWSHIRYKSIKRKGPTSFTIHGELRHHTGSLKPLPNQKASYAQLYIYDPNSALDIHNRRNPKLRRNVLGTIQDSLLQVNPFVGDGTKASGLRDIILHLKGNNGLMRINECHPAYLPLHYVLLFPQGELGWDPDFKQWDVSNDKASTDQLTQL